MDLLTWDAKLSQMCRHPAVIGDLTDVAGEAQDVQAQVWRELETKIAPAHDSVPSSAAAMGYLDIDPTGPEEAIDKLQRLQFAIVPMLDLLTAMTNGYYRAASALNNSLLELVVPTTDKIVGGRPFGSSLSHDRSPTHNANSPTAASGGAAGINVNVDMPDMSMHSNSSNVFPVISHSSQNKVRSRDSASARAFGANPQQHYHGASTQPTHMYGTTTNIRTGSWLTPSGALALARRILRVVNDLILILLQLFQVR
jgi:hypothetical protein